MMNILISTLNESSANIMNLGSNIGAPPMTLAEKAAQTFAPGEPFVIGATLIIFGSIALFGFLLTRKAYPPRRYRRTPVRNRFI